MSQFIFIHDMIINQDSIDIAFWDVIRREHVLMLKSGRCVSLTKERFLELREAMFPKPKPSELHPANVNVDLMMAYTRDEHGILREVPLK